jgi:hypothetical protein
VDWWKKKKTKFAAWSLALQSKLCPTTMTSISIKNKRTNNTKGVHDILP